ncbi:hypothetical protein, partial [Pseudomonas aeruginosa]|uniref:hypothetical protein n=1 Tax=Pseudomonas aeruginosa TaxID=287 RepID=UPI001F09D9DF
MNRMGQLALFGLLVGTSSNLFAAPGSISGVIRFTGAIVEPPCSMNASRQGEAKGSFHLSGCPMQARTAEVSIRSMKTGEVQHLQPSDLVLGECSGQPIPDSGLSFSSATAGGNPSLN